MALGSATEMSFGIVQSLYSDMDDPCFFGKLFGVAFGFTSNEKRYFLEFILSILAPNLNQVLHLLLTTETDGGTALLDTLIIPFCRMCLRGG